MWIPPSAAIAGGYSLSLALRQRRAQTVPIGVAGAALAAFSVLGPADGLL